MALAAVARPALVHFDLWDGNVLAEETDGGWRLAGLVDGERHLYGDPLVDLVSPAIFRRIEDDAACTRLCLYRLHLYLVMLVEMPSRGMSGPHAESRGEHVARLLAEELSLLD